MSDPIPIRKVSIITVTCNNLFYTKRFLKSLARYTPQEPIAWDLIVVDNGSSDGTVEWFKEQKIIKRCEVITLDCNMGWTKALNIGITEALNRENDVIIWSNNDVVLDSKGWLSRLCAHFDELTGAVGPTSNYVAGKQKTDFNTGIAEEPANTLIGFFVAVRREAVEQVGFMDEELGPLVEVDGKLTRIGGADDHDYSIRLRQSGWSLKIARDVFVFHYGSKTFDNVFGVKSSNNWNVPDSPYLSHCKAADECLTAKWGQEVIDQLFKPLIHVGWGIPLRSWHTHWKFARSYRPISIPFPHTIFDAPRGQVDFSRCEIAKQAIKFHCDYLFMTDDDHVFPADVFLRLFGHMQRNPNIGVIGALAFRRIAPYGPCVFDFQTDPNNGKTAIKERPELIRTGLQKVDAVGCSGILIKTSIFEKLGPDGPERSQAWFAFDELGEDGHFCLRCYDAGVEVWCDTDLILPHINDDGMEITEQHYFNAVPGNGHALGFVQQNAVWVKPKETQTRVQVA